MKYIILLNMLLFIFPSPITKLYNADNEHDATAPNAPQVILIDKAHNNLNILNNWFDAFIQTLTNNGYDVQFNTSPFSFDALNHVDVLVVSNALHKKNISKWSLPVYSAFTNKEIDVVYNWIAAGGSLLLIADHMPFPAASQKLAEKFDFHLNNGFALDSRKSKSLIFSREKGSLAAHEITNGQSIAERIDSVCTFAGHAFQPPENATPLLVFPANIFSYMPKEAWKFNAKSTRIISVENWCQGAVLELQNGKVAMFGEAAMFSNRYLEKQDQWMGFNAKGAEQNKQFMLNVMRWLGER